jgi:uncharacterized membrane protein (DUF106 family)
MVTIRYELTQLEKHLAYVKYKEGRDKGALKSLEEVEEEYRQAQARLKSYQSPIRYI